MSKIETGIVLNNKNRALSDFTRRLAFTLAEVLIVLGIVGIVAEMTVPVIVNNVNEATYNAGVKKAYSTLSQALLRIQADQGGLVNIGNGTSSANRAALRTEFEPYIVFLKKDTPNNLFTPLNYTMYKTNVFSGFPWAETDQTAAITADGMYIYFNNLTNCNNRGTLQACANIQIDINGPKGPNQYGVDMHSFSIYVKNGVQAVTPEGTPGDTMGCAPGNPSWWTSSLGCTAKRLLDPGNMP